MYPKAHDNIANQGDTTILTELAKSVYYWLNYINSVSRTELLLESSLRYPISEFTERRLHQTCFLEIQHPHFETRPMDFVWLNDFSPEAFDSKKFCNNAFIMECKCAAYGMNNQEHRQDIFDDLCRLYFVLHDCPEARALFMMAGEKEPFKKQFEKARTRTSAETLSVSTKSKEVKLEDVSSENIVIKENTIELNKDKYKSNNQVNNTKKIFVAAYKDWFNFDIDNPIKEISTEEVCNSRYYETFKKIYKPSYLQDIHFRTRLVAYIEQDENASIYMRSSQVVAIWQVELCPNKTNNE